MVLNVELLPVKFLLFSPHVDSQTYVDGMHITSACHSSITGSIPGQGIAVMNLCIAHVVMQRCLDGT